jgi:hypothetical protein
LKSLCDIQTAQFFIPKSPENKGAIITDGAFRQYMNGIGVFRGGQKLTGAFGQRFLEYVKCIYAPAGSCDLVTYFFRRIFTLLKPGGFQALISTNTIAQGAAREGGLDVITKNDGSIHFAVRSMKWPGLAAVEVALVGIYKGSWKRPCVLGSISVPRITSYLDDAEISGNPYPLIQNADKSFQGSIVLGKGFVLEPWEAERLIKKNPKNKEVLFPYLNGEDLNTNPDQSPSRWVINFFDWPEEKCRKEYPECFEIVERLVKPVRLIDNRESYRKYWWQYAEKRLKLYRSIEIMERVLVSCRVSKYVNHSLIESHIPEKEIEKQLVKETMTLWNHLHRTPDTCAFNQAVADILELRRLHREMDETVLKAYGWTDIHLAHDFYEVDYLPENDRIRYTISPAARKEILKHLLKLNHTIHAQEIQDGDFPKGKSRKKRKMDDEAQLSLF